MNYNFVEFKNKNIKTISNYISFRNSSGFYFSSAFVRQERLKDKKFVILFYDEGNNAIGFLFFKDMIENSMQMVSAGRKSSSYGFQLLAKTFRKEFNLNKEGNFGKKIPVKKFVEFIGEMYIINL